MIEHPIFSFIEYKYKKAYDCKPSVSPAKP